MAAAAAVERARPLSDLVGLGLRPQLTLDILEHAPSIGLVEVIADDLFRAGPQDLDALRLVAEEIPLTLHGVGMGLASAIPVEQRRLDDFARLLEKLRPVSWSEHLAFVRAGGREIGHMAAPPRTRAVIEGTARNVERARLTTGVLPALENIATLVEPPVCEFSEPQWINEILKETGCSLLLDLHNLYANAINTGLDPFDVLKELDAGSISMIHLSGGCWIEQTIDGVLERRLLDDHLHDPPPIVYELLTETALRAPGPLSVIIERDGRFPEFALLLSQVQLALQALQQGRVLRSGL